MAKSIQEHINIEGGKIVYKCPNVFSYGNKHVLVYEGYAAMEVLDKWFSDIYGARQIGKYKKLMTLNSVDVGGGSFKVTKTLPDAIIPSKPHVTDIGFDLTVIKKLKTSGDVTFYDSGIAITPSLGYFCMLAPRSSISKSGYMLANSVGIIDPSYTGNFIVALRKVDKDADDITLPCRIAQIIPQRAYYPEFVNVERLDETTRGSGGFGSSGN